MNSSKLDYDLVDYVSQLREGILEAYTGIVTGLKNTEKGKQSPGADIPPSDMLCSVQLLLPHVPSILELIQRCLSDEERTDALVRLAMGLLGDLADCFPNGEIKQLLLSEWVAMELRSKGRLPPEVKKTVRWAREVCSFRA
jgi:importin subunit beta-1